MGINTEQAQPGQDRPLYVWHETGEKYTWPQLLRLWGSEIASKQAGEAGVWICERLDELAEAASIWRLAGPAQQTQHRAEEADAHRSYVAAPERDAQWDPGDEPESQFDPCDPSVFGSMIGPDEEAATRYWVAPPNDDTYAN